MGTQLAPLLENGTQPPIFGSTEIRLASDWMFFGSAFAALAPRSIRDIVSSNAECIVLHTVLAGQGCCHIMQL